MGILDNVKSSLNNVKNNITSSLKDIKNNTNQKFEEINEQNKLLLDNQEKLSFYKRVLNVIHYGIMNFHKLLIFAFVCIIILFYIVILASFIDGKRAAYSSVNKDNNTQTSLAHFKDIQIYGGVAITTSDILIYIAYFFLTFILIYFLSYSSTFSEVYKYISNSYDKDLSYEEEKGIYFGIIFVILLIFSIFYWLRFGYAYTYNPLKTLKDDIDNLQNKIYNNINKSFLWYVLNFDIDESLIYKEVEVDGKIIYKNPSTDEVMTEAEKNAAIDKIMKSNYEDKITFDISSIHIKIDNWLYKGVDKIKTGKCPIQTANTVDPKNTDFNDFVNCRFKILITSVILAYYTNSQNILPIIDNINDETYRANIFLYANQNTSSILPPLNVLKTTTLYKTIISPPEKTCKFGNSNALNSRQIEKLEEMYTNFKQDIDTLFKKLHSANDPFGHKVSIITSFLILSIYLAFIVQLFYWTYKKQTILKYWHWFLWHYGRFFVLIIMIILVI